MTERQILLLGGSGQVGQELFCENASLAAPKTTTSSAFAASAPSKPFMLGVSTE